MSFSSSSSFCLVDSATLTKGKVDSAFVKFTVDWKDGTVDSLSSQFISAPHLYKVSGSYSVEMIGLDSNGCRDTFSKKIWINPTPASKAFVFDDSLCQGTFLKFKSQSTISAGWLLSIWGLDGNTISNKADDSILLNTIGTYKLQLKSVSDSGCTDSTILPITVLETPDAKFTLNDTGFCFNGHSLKAKSTSTISSGTINSYWTFGDGSASNQGSPTHSYAGFGDYWLTLTATSNFACQDRDSQFVRIFPSPSAGFSINDSSQCLNGNKVIFTNNSVVASGNLSYSWSFGDLTSSGQKEPNHSYSNSGEYDVLLVVSSDKGCDDSLGLRVRIHPEPIASFVESRKTGCEKDDVFRFSNKSQISKGALNSSWYVNAQFSSNSTDFVQAFSSHGNYSIKLLSTSNEGCIDSSTLHVVVHPKPQVSTTHGTACKQASLQFVNTTKSIDTISTYEWNFSDKSQSFLKSPAIYLATRDTLVYQLVTNTNKGCSDTLLDTVFTGQTPSASFQVANVCVGDSLMPTLASINPAIKYTWFIDSLEVQAINPKIKRNRQGKHPLKLVAVDTASGCLDSSSKTVTVFPTPSLLFSKAGVCESDSFRFSALGTFHSVQWVVDGDTLRDSSILYKFDSSGYYHYSFRATSGKGCVADTADSVFVYPLPKADFNVAATYCIGATLKTKNSSQGATRFEWELSNATDSTKYLDYNLEKNLSDTGQFSLRLVASSNQGCLDTSGKSFAVWPNPNPDFSLLGIACEGDSFQLQPTVVNQQGNYLWSINGQNVGTKTILQHLLPSEGVYSAKLALITNHGCVDSLEKTIQVKPKPKAHFQSTNVCQGDSLFVTNLSKGDWQVNKWYLDGVLTQETADFAELVKPGQYSLKLLLNNQTCLDSFIDTFQVFRNPTIQETFDIQCTGEASQFEALTPNIIDHSWQFNDGWNGTGKRIQRVFTSGGVYNLTLQVTSNKGCVSDSSYTISIAQSPKAAFSTSPACVNTVLEFVNSSKAGTSQNLEYSWTTNEAEFSTQKNGQTQFGSSGIKTVELEVSDENGCSHKLAHNVRIWPAPTAQFTVDDVCFTEVIQVENESTGATIYKWNFGDGQGFSTLRSPFYQYQQAGNYQVNLMVEDHNGCLDSTQRSVEVYALPSPEFLADSICLGQTLQANAMSPAAAHQWKVNGSEAGSNPALEFKPSTAGIYRVFLKITTLFGCEDSTSRNIDVHPLPQLQLVPNATISKGDEIEVWAIGAQEYEWTSLENIDNPRSSNIWVRPENSADFYVTGTSEFGCQSDSSVFVTVENDVKLIPMTVITPDGNGKNDRWVIRNIDLYPECRVSVLNRWGAEVYSTTAYQNDWEGEGARGKLPDGTYFYVIECGDSKVYKGNLTILNTSR